MYDRLTTRNEHGDAILCDRLQGIGICLNDDVECVAQYEDELEARRWISVEERLPELIPCNAGTAYSEAVIVWTDGRKAMIAVWNGKHFICPSFFWCADEENITHWMPLPESPEAIERKEPENNGV